MSNPPLFFFLQCLQGTSCFCPLKHLLLSSLAARLYNSAWTVLWTFQTSNPTWVSAFNACLNQPHDEHHSVQQASQELHVSLWKITGVLGERNTLPFVYSDHSNTVMLEAVCSRKLRNRLILGQLFLCSKAQFLWVFRDHWAGNSVLRKWEHCVLLS